MADASYTLTSIPRADRQIGELLIRAAALGIGDQLLSALKTVYRELRSGPDKFGDPAHRTKKAGGMAYNAVVEPISVHYVVYRIEKVVSVLDVKPLSRFFPEQA